MIPVWDPADFPVDRPGRLAEALWALEIGEMLCLPDRTRMGRDGVMSWRVTRLKKITAGLSADEAAIDALDRSARGRQPTSIGGSRSFPGYAAFLAAAHAGLARDPSRPVLGVSRQRSAARTSSPGSPVSA